MENSSTPTDPLAFQEWINKIEQKWQAGLIPNPQAIAVILINYRDEVLLQLRDSNPNISFPDTWTLPGGTIENAETAEQAGKRELLEEIGINIEIYHWKTFERKPEYRQFSIDQHVYIGRINKEIDEMILGEGQALRFFRRDELSNLSIAFDFQKLIIEFFDQYQQT